MEISVMLTTHWVTECHKEHIKIAKEIDDRAGEGNAYGNLGNAYRSLGELEKAIEYHERRLKIAIEIGDRAGQGKAYGNLANAYHSLGAFRKATECYERDLTVAVEIGDRAGEGKAYHNIGYGYFSLGQFEKAVDNFVSAVEVFHTLRSLLKSEDGWKIFVSFTRRRTLAYGGRYLKLERSRRLCMPLIKDERKLCLTICIFNIILPHPF